MASAAIGTASLMFSGGGHGGGIPKLFCLVRSSTTGPLAFRRRLPARLLLASSTASFETTPPETITLEKEVNGGGGLDNSSNILACPICYRPLSLISNGTLNVGRASTAKLQCSCCRKTYFGKETHVELIAASGAKSYDNPMPIATEFFRLPLISFLYERGWRQNFAFGGFPGVEKEFELIKNYAKPVLGGNIVDASCGSGLFARVFAKSGLFSLVVALDYSENMLQQCYEFVKQEDDFPQEKLVLVRADISRLPFVTGSIDVVHAGAAIHCWPSPSSAVAEISRVLKPGGVFVGTTYILDGPLNAIPFLGAIRQNVSELTGAYSFISEGELEDICQACGLEGFTCVRNRQFVMFSARKPL